MINIDDFEVLHETENFIAFAVPDLTFTTIKVMELYEAFLVKGYALQEHSYDEAKGHYRIICRKIYTFK
jgi:hypothetical protein